MMAAPPTAYTLYRTLWTALDWLYPPVCGGCGQGGSRWCANCNAGLTDIRSILGNLCPTCGTPQTQSQICKQCHQQPPPLQQLRSVAVYEGALRKAILQCKYGGNLSLGEALSKPLIAYYNHLRWNVHLIVPVPLGKARARSRGYNQAGLLARPLAYAVGKPYQPGALIRTRETPPQARMNAQQRHANVQNAFQAAAGQVAGKAILLIDDVTTTGSTLSACAQALMGAGASEVYGLTLARALAHQAADDPSDSSS